MPKVLIKEKIETTFYYRKIHTHKFPGSSSREEEAAPKQGLTQTEEKKEESEKTEANKEEAKISDDAVSSVNQDLELSDDEMDSDSR